MSTTVSFSTGVVDTVLKQASPTASFGGATSIGPDGDTGSKVQTLLEFGNLFGTGPGQIPLGATITSASLTLQTTNGSGNGGSLYRMLTDWNGAATWNVLGDGVQIGTETSAADLNVGAVSLGSRAFDVTKSLQAWADGQANNGWLFNTPSTDGWFFDSSEGSTKPSLTVTYTTGTTPPPSTPTVSIQAGTPNPQTEGANAKIAFTVSLAQAATQNVVVNYSTVDNTATAASDFFGKTNGSITFLAGETTKTIDILLKDDAVVEQPEAFTVKLNSATNAQIGTATATGNIVDNDNTSSPPPRIQASVVKVTDTTSAPYRSVDATGYGSGDPSGLAYVPGLQKLFIADSEHEERPYFSSTNLFSTGLNSTIGAYNSTSITKEPTGLGYNPNNGYLYIADDDAQAIFWVDPANPSVKIGQFSTSTLGFLDTEDPKFDPDTGHMFVVDGSLKKLFELTHQGAFVSSIALPIEMKDAEALAYDPNHDVFFIASGSYHRIWEMDRSGNILAKIDVLGETTYVNPITGVKPVPKGMELAPSSDPNDGNTMNLFVADYGVDQQNDGRLFEINLGADWLVA